MSTPQTSAEPHSLRAARIIENAPALLVLPERWILYALVLGLQPRRCLEIGTHRGGSALITVAALDAVGSGSIVCIEDNPCIAPEHWAMIKHRVELREGKSQAILPTLDPPFDFAFVDGDHSTEGATRDLELALPLMSREAYILCHDSYNAPVNAAIRSVIARHPVIDCGILTAIKAWEPDRSAAWGGMHLLRLSREG
jgi:predicted O-methyltransferase YrrM